MIVERAAEIRPFEEPRDLPFFGGGKLAMVFTQLRRDRGQRLDKLRAFD